MQNELCGVTQGASCFPGLHYKPEFLTTDES